MTTPPSFPTLPGLGWSVHKRPTFATRIAGHVSGREVRAPLYYQGLYEFELTIEGLDSNGTWTGLTANSLQSLMGLYIQLQGQYGTFLYTDPTDNSAVAQPTTQAFGDGVTTAFTFGRAIGGAVEPVSWVTAVSNVYLNGVNQPSGWTATTPNTLTFTIAPPAGTTSAQLLAEDNTTNYHYTTQSLASQASGTKIVFAAYVQAQTRTACQLEINDGVTNQQVNANLSTGAITSATGGVLASSITNLGGGWYWVSMTVNMAATAAPTLTVLTANPVGTTNYAGTTGDGIYVAGAVAAIGSVAPTALPVWSTVSHATVSSAAITLPPATAITATFTYAFNCRFLDDQEDFENFMNGLWRVQTLKFRMVKP
jgi:hypothetical protein